MKKAAIVTGAGSGPGSKSDSKLSSISGTAVALKLSEQGYFVYLVGPNTPEYKESLQEVALRCRQGASIIGCDLNDSVGGRKKVFSDILSVKIHCLEVLVNNSDQNSLAECQNLTAWVIPSFQTMGRGCIINLVTDPSYQEAFGTWTRQLNQDLSPLGIHASMVESAENIGETVLKTASRADSETDSL